MTVITMTAIDAMTSIKLATSVGTERSFREGPDTACVELQPQIRHARCRRTATIATGAILTLTVTIERANAAEVFEALRAATECAANLQLQIRRFCRALPRIGTQVYSLQRRSPLA